MANKKQTEIFMRNFIFGVEDSLVSTVGLLSGIAVGGAGKVDIFLTGVVLVFVEAFSMGVGSFLSQDAVEDRATQKKAKITSIVGAVIMFASYLIAGIIPLTPYIVLPFSEAFILSIAFSLFSLFVLGAVSALKFKRPVLELGTKAFIMGGLAILIGILVGRIIFLTQV